MDSEPAPKPPTGALPRAYRAAGERFVDALEDILDDDAVGVWLVGSAALGDFSHDSDLDLVAATATPPDASARAAILCAADAEAAALPPGGLDLLLVDWNRVAEPRGDRGGALRVRAGAGFLAHIEAASDDPSLTTELEACRQTGRALFGPHALRTFGRVPRDDLLDAMAAELRAHIARIHDPKSDPWGDQAVLAGCRIWAFHATGRWLDKSRAGRWAQTRLTRATVIPQALAIRRHGARRPLAPVPIVLFLRQIERVLRGGRFAGLLPFRGPLPGWADGQSDRDNPKPKYSTR